MPIALTDVITGGVVVIVGLAIGLWLGPGRSVIARWLRNAPNDTVAAHRPARTAELPDLYGRESVSAIEWQHPRLRVEVKPITARKRGPTDDEIVAHDPEIQEMLRGIHDLDDEIEVLREARHTRQARRGWFFWRREPEPVGDSAIGEASGIREM